MLEAERRLNLTLSSTNQPLKLDIRKLQHNYNFPYYLLMNILNNLAVEQVCVKEKFTFNFYFAPNRHTHISALDFLS